MSQLSAHQFKQVFTELGYDLSKLGCIMMTVEDIDIRDNIDERHLYYARDEARFWIKGLVADQGPHVTLLYGLLRSGPELSRHVDAVLEGWELPTVTIDHVGLFESPYDDEPYACLVAHLEITDQLIEANERLKFLPHINTFPGYKAHITLAYVRQEYGKRYVTELDTVLAGKKIETKALDYGGRH